MGFDITESITEFVRKMRYGDLPQEVTAIAKYAVIDYISVAIAGTAEPVSSIIRNAVLKKKENNGATVFGLVGKYSIEQATIVNGTAGHALDYDDVQVEEIHGHPSATILPAVLALGEVLGSSGREILLSYIIGVEVMSKLGASVGPSHYAKGWHATATLGTIGAAVAVSNIIGLSLVAVKSAIGIASSFASGLRCNFGSMVKPLHAGWAARNGVMAALLAQQGFNANEDALGAAAGFISCFCTESLEKAAHYFDELGVRYSIVNPGLNFKAYPCCAGTHKAIDAALSVKERLTKSEHSVDDITEITCYCNPVQLTSLRYSEPSDPVQAKFSMEFCVARALLKGKVGLSDFSQETIMDAETNVLMRKIRLAPREVKLLDTLATIEVKFLNNDIWYEKCEFPLGHPRNPMREETRILKYKQCVEPLIGIKQTLDGLYILNNLEMLNDIKELMNTLKFKL